MQSDARAGVSRLYTQQLKLPTDALHVFYIDAIGFCSSDSKVTSPTLLLSAEGERKAGLRAVTEGFGTNF